MLARQSAMPASKKTTIPALATWRQGQTHLPHRLVAMLLLELQEVCLLSGDLLRQDVLQRRQGSLAAGEVPEGALVRKRA